MFWISSRAVRSTMSLFALCLIFSNIVYAQDYCSDGFGFPGLSTPLIQKKVTNINIPGTSSIKGYLEKLPDDYNSNPTKKYPLLIFIHGINETGSGSIADLCKLIGIWWWTPSTLPEWTSGPMFPASVTDQNGQTHKFIVISPQLTDFGANANTTLNSLIDYLVNRYRVDLSRVYLTGLSAGANFVQSYVTASEANAKRIAAITPMSPCARLSAAGANIIARTNLPYWTFQCTEDYDCDGYNAMNNANLINSQSPAPAIPAKHTTFPIPEQPCNSYPHNAWGFGYDHRFKQVVNGRNVNSYEWMVQYSRASLLPVALENYNVTLRDGKVIVRWTTSAENNNAHFNVERSADGSKFTEIATIPAVGNNNGKTYEWIDERPLPNLSYYRLTQTDLDGRQEWFQVKKVLNRVALDRSIIIAPNPFTTELTAFINVPQTQKVTITITDLSGRVLKTANGKYAQGAAEINIKTTGLPKGSYFLKVQGENFAQTQKIVKQ